MEKELLGFLERIAVSLEDIAGSLREQKALMRRMAAGQPLPLPVKPDYAPEPVDSESDIRSLLAKHYIIFCDAEPTIVPDVIDKEMDKIAYYIGMRYRAVEPLMYKLKKFIKPGMSTFTLRARGLDPYAIRSMCELCSYLHELAFLEEYHFREAPECKIEAQVNAIGLVQNFISGGWFERYIAKVTADVADHFIKANPQLKSFDILRNVKVETLGREERELDVLLGVGNELYWIECKSGEWQSSLSKYQNIAAEHGFTSDHAFLVIAKTAAERRGTFSYEQYGIKICDIENFGRELAAALTRDLQRQPQLG
ncbi:MAG: hypothetical protein K6G50_12685 [bacterium]|nr:hypothetical protein [bacterium]